MAYQYDAMGNIIGEYESEEERLAREKAEREAAQAQVQKQEVITRADGTQTVKTTQEVPAPVAPTVAQAAPVAAPVSPNTFGRMQQVESGNRDFDAQGRPITSPAGAMFRNQVMPATAAQPGFGIRPAQAQTPEEYNRVGQEYYQALLKKYNGDERAAAAAYNAGPGRVDQNMARNQGQMNVAQLPRETQGYLEKVFNAIIPSAQAGTLPQPQAGAGRGGAGMPMAQPGPGVAVATGRGVLGTMTTEAPAPAPAAETPAGPGGLRIPSFATGVPTPPPAPDTAAQIDRYQSIQDSPLDLLQLRADETAPSWMRERAGKRAAELLRQEENKVAAEERAQALAAQAASGDPKAGREMAKELQNKEGSWVKMILLGFLSPQLAGEEAMKLGFGNKDRTVYDADGNVGVITFRADGKPLNGIKADGTPMSQRELIVYAGGGQRQLDIVGGTYVNDTTGEVGRVVTDKKTGQSFIQTDTGRKPMSGFRPQASTGTLANMRERMIQEINLKLQGKTAEEQMAILRPYNQQLVASKYAPIDPSEVGIKAPQISGAQTAPTAQPPAPPAPATAAAPVAPGAQPPAPATAAAPVAPGGVPTAPATGARPTGPELEARAAAAKTGAVTEARETAEDIAKVRASQGKAERQADYLITKMDELVKHPGFETSVGAQGATYLFGALDKPLPPQLGGGPARDWQNRAREVIGGGFVQAIEALKGFGALSDAEGKSAAAAIQRLGYMDPKTNLPVVTATEAEFRAAVKDFQEVIQRNIDGNRVKLGQKPKYGTPPESIQNAPTAPVAPQAIESPADKARAELERRRKNQGR